MRDSKPRVSRNTAREIAAAVDNILRQYPFLDLCGIEMADLDGTVSRVVRDRPVDDARTAAWIVLDRISTANSTVAETIRTATEFRQPAADSSDERPMHSTVVRELGQILEKAAGPRIRQLAQRAQITEYHRVSGPWDRNNTLAGVVRGYRKWCAQLSGRSFLGNRFQARIMGGYRWWRDWLGGNSIADGWFRPHAALAAAFAEMELRGDDPCGPARVLYRLLIEGARGRSTPQ